ncbi:MAG: long-chain acyl-CoA synthetase [Synergistales bacterium]|nr:long-chain acyl-CoA synthetase [Synergistales bacterium]MDN5336318.1 long-chain acyl-CoA synthetase [Synergistales bacterium]
MTSRLEKRILERCIRCEGEKSFWWQNTWWSRRVLSDLSARCEKVLKDAGLGEGSRLAVLLPNSPLFIALMIAVWKLGGVLVPLNLLAGKTAIGSNLKHADVAGAVLPQGMEQAAEDFAGIGIPTVTAPLDGPLPGFKCRAVDGSDPDTAVIFYTSGTTGAPKGVPISHANLLENIEASTGHLTDLREDDIFLNALPNFHALGFNVSGLLPLVGGFPQVLLPSFMPAENALHAIHSAGVTVIVAVPTMVNLLLGTVTRGATPPSTLRMIISGGDKLPAKIDARAEKMLGLGVLEGYGLTETSPVVSVNPNYASRKPGTAGTILPGYDVQIRSSDGKVLPPGKEGTLWLRGPSVFGEYFRDQHQTEERIRDGWFNTGDVVRMDDEGYLSILDRESDIIIVGGFNVYPAEVESVLQEVPGVRESAVVGVSHSVSGEIVKACVVKDPDSGIQARDIISFCRENLALYKVPRLVEFVDELPRSNIGKVLRRELRSG